MNFSQQKKKQFSKQDRSSKQSYDEAIIPLCRKINSNPAYYTTSSCAGRILLIKASETKKPGLFIFKTHDKITFRQLKEELKRASKDKNLIYFKQDPCILHVSARDINSAQILLDKAKFTGWKRSGMIASKKRIMLELMSTEHLSLPIMNKGKILFSDEYLHLLVKEANSKLEKTREKLKKLEKII